MVKLGRIHAKVSEEAPNLKRSEYGNYAVDESFAKPSHGSPVLDIKLARRSVQNGLQFGLGCVAKRLRLVLRQDPI